MGACAGASRFAAGVVLSISTVATGISVEKADANGSVSTGAATTAMGSLSSPNSVNAVSNAASKMLPPTALPFPFTSIGLRNVSAIRISQECGPSSAFCMVSPELCSILNNQAPESAETK
jgi:hypothetical protein